MIPKKKVKEIVGDSTGIEAAQKIAEWAMENSSYKVYETPGRCGKTFKQELEFERRRALNCSDSYGLNKYKERRRLHKKMQELKEDETITVKFETPKEFIDKFMHKKYSKMETVLSKVLEENPGTNPTDFEIHYDAYTKEPVAIYKKVKVYDFTK